MATPVSFRLPSPPDQYNLGFMTRLINALELDKRTSFFAASKATNNLSNETKLMNWFMS
jgi:hypothetical protein